MLTPRSCQHTCELSPPSTQIAAQSPHTPVVTKPNPTPQTLCPATYVPRSLHLACWQQHHQAQRLQLVLAHCPALNRKGEGHRGVLVEKLVLGADVHHHRASSRLQGAAARHTAQHSTAQQSGRHSAEISLERGAHMDEAHTWAGQAELCSPDPALANRQNHQRHAQKSPKAANTPGRQQRGSSVNAPVDLAAAAAASASLPAAASGPWVACLALPGACCPCRRCC